MIEPKPKSIRRVSLTSEHVKRARYEGKGNRRCVTWDAKITGLGLRVYPSGRKAFVFSYRLAGRKELVTIGSASTWTLDQARQRARELDVSVDKGKSPLAARLEQRRIGLTVAKVVGIFLAQHVERKALKTAKAYRQRLERTVVREWGARPIGSITGEDMERIFQRISADSPTEANRVAQAVSKLFSFAIKKRYVTHAPGDPSRPPENPAKFIDKNIEAPRKREISDDEMKRLLAAINEYPNVYIAAALKTLALTGARKGEILGLRWENVDLDGGAAYLPETKNGTPRTIVLPPAAVDILKALPREAQNPHVFVGHLAGSHLTWINKAWEAICAAAKVEDARIHDLREYVATALVRRRESVEVTSAALGHRDTRVTQRHYARIPASITVTPMHRHAAHLEELGLGAGPAPTSEEASDAAQA